MKKFQSIYNIVENPSASLVRYPNRFAIFQGQLHVFSMSVYVDYSVIVTVGQISETQDHSLRLWFSELPNGKALDEIFWHANRPPVRERAVLTTTTGGAGLPFLIRTTPGLKYLNILNLINSQNAYELTFES